MPHHKVLELLGLNSDDEDEARSGGSTDPSGPAAPSTSNSNPSHGARRDIDIQPAKPGRRVISLRAQPQPLQDLFHPALDNLSGRLFGLEPLPDRRTRADMKLTSIMEAIQDNEPRYRDIEERIWADEGYAKLYVTLVSTNIIRDRSKPHDGTDLSWTVRTTHSHHAHRVEGDL